MLVNIVSIIPGEVSTLLNFYCYVCRAEVDVHIVCNQVYMCSYVLGTFYMEQDAGSGRINSCHAVYGK